MLKLGDLVHLPQLDPLVDQLVADRPGLVIVAGFDPRLTSAPSNDSFLPSGRSAIFRILMDSILATRQKSRAIVVAEDKAFMQIPRQRRRQITRSQVELPLGYTDQIALATHRRPDLLVIDQLCAENALAVLDAVQAGTRVLTMLDTVFRGAGVARQLLDWGVPRERLNRSGQALTWVVTV